MERYEIKHLTQSGGRWVLHGTVPDKEAEALDRAIGLGLPLFGDNKSKLMRVAVTNTSLEPVYQERVRLALEDLAALRDIHGEDMPAYAIQLIKILTGCPNTAVLEFTGESDAYREFWAVDREQEDAS